MTRRTHGTPPPRATLSEFASPAPVAGEMTEFDQDNESDYTVVVISSDLSEAKKPEARILRDLRRCGYRNETTFAIKLTLEEAMTNAVKHGNRGDRSKRVTISYSITPERAIFCICDEGPGFDPDEVPDPTSPERLPLPDGRGIMLMRAYMDELYFRKRGREVYFMKRRS